MNRFFVCLGVCGWLLANGLVPVAWAAGRAPLEVNSVKIGLAGRFQVGSWTPVIAKVQTSGSSSVAAKLVIVAPDADGQLVRTSGPQKNLTPGKPDSLHARFISGRMHGEIVIRVESPEGLLYERRIRPQAQAGAEGELQAGFRQDSAFWGLCGLPATVFERAVVKTADTDPKATTTTRLDELAPELISLVPDDLPDAAPDLASLDVLILASSAEVPGVTGTFLSRLSLQQQQALREWVEIRGGHLVLSVGSHLPEFQQSLLAKWLKLPLEEEISIRQLEGLESYSPYPSLLRVTGSVPSIRVGNAPGTILARSLDGPLLFQVPYGFGRVTFLAVDLERPPVATWEGLGHLIRKALSTERDQVREIRVQGAQLAKSSVNDLSSQLFASLETFPGVVRPSLWTVMGLLGIYILIVGPLDYVIVHRWLRRPHWTWITLAIWVGIGGALVVMLSNRLNGTQLLSTQLEIVDVDEVSHVLRGQSWLTLYSPRTTRHAVKLAEVVPDWSSGGTTQVNAPLVSWTAPAENRIGGLYREGGTQFTEREYQALGASNGESSPGYANVPFQVWSTARFEGGWSGSAPKIVESKLVSSELGRLSGTVEHHLPVALTDCLLAYANRVYMPAIRRSQNADKGSLQPNFVWEIGGGQPVEQRELRSFLTQVYMKEITRDTVKGAPEMMDMQTPYDPTRRDAEYIIQMLTFHQASGGRDYTGMRHDVLGNLDMSTHLRMGRAILFGRLPKASAEWKVGDQVITDPNAQTFVRIVLPVDRGHEEEGRILEKPDEGIPRSN